MPEPKPPFGYEQVVNDWIAAQSSDETREKIKPIANSALARINGWFDNGVVITGGGTELSIKGINFPPKLLRELPVQGIISKSPRDWGITYGFRPDLEWDINQGLVIMVAPEAGSNLGYRFGPRNAVVFENPGRNQFIPALGQLIDIPIKTILTETFKDAHVTIATGSATYANPTSLARAMVMCVADLKAHTKLHPDAEKINIHSSEIRGAGLVAARR